MAHLETERQAYQSGYTLYKPITSISDKEKYREVGIDLPTYIRRGKRKDGGGVVVVLVG